jgi:hypothetical protein
MKACHKERVHFGVGAVDTMSCPKCRGYEADLEALNGDETTAAEKKRAKILEEQSKHFDHVKSQREAYWAHLKQVESDNNFGIVSMDFSHLVQSDRGTVQDLCCVVTKSKNDGSGVCRTFVDFLGIPCRGRKRDVVFWVLLELKKQGFLEEGMSYAIWSDFGVSDFHSAPAMYAFAAANEALRLQEAGVTLESFNFFGARHGWNDCDRHFGTISRVITKWFAKEATPDPSAILDVPQLMRILSNKIQCTHVFDCRAMDIPGVFCNSVPGLTLNHCFETVCSAAQDGSVLRIIAKEHSQDPLGRFIDLPGKMVSATDAKRVAWSKRKRQKLASLTEKSEKKEKKKSSSKKKRKTARK